MEDLMSWKWARTSVRTNLTDSWQSWPRRKGDPKRRRNEVNYVDCNFDKLGAAQAATRKPAWQKEAKFRSESRNISNEYMLADRQTHKSVGQEHKWDEKTSLHVYVLIATAKEAAISCRIALERMRSWRKSSEKSIKQQKDLESKCQKHKIMLVGSSIKRLTQSHTLLYLVHH